MPASMLGAARETSAAPTGSSPSGSSAARRAATVSGGVAAVRSRSTYSSSLEKPSGMAGLKESRGIGWCPCEKASGRRARRAARSEEHTSELQSQSNLVCRLLLEKKKKKPQAYTAAQE